MHLVTACYIFVYIIIWQIKEEKNVIYLMQEGYGNSYVTGYISCDEE